MKYAVVDIVSHQVVRFGNCPEADLPLQARGDHELVLDATPFDINSELDWVFDPAAETLIESPQ